jgi:cholesterol transport system auxiliary component
MRRSFLVLLATAPLLPACAAINLASREPPQLYALTPKSTFDADIPDLGRVRVQVEPPTAAAGLNTARIALKPTPTTLQYFAGATWIEVLPIMVQTLLIESFETTGSVEPVASAAVGIRSDWALRLYIREFQAEYVAPDTPPSVRVRLQPRLLRLPRRTEAGVTDVESTQPAASTSLDDIVLAMDEALGTAMRDTVEWTLRTMAAQR